MSGISRIGFSKTAVAGTCAIAVPAAALFVFSPSAPSNAHAVTRPARVSTAAVTAQPAIGQAAQKQKQCAEGPAGYSVQAGDSLSAIATRCYHDAAAWTVIYWANHRQIRWANDIRAGQILRIPVLPARIPAPPAALAPPPPPPPTVAVPVVPASVSARPVVMQSAVDTAYYRASAGYSAASSAFGRCVITRESGGNSQVMNATGHYGLYQFAAGTWAHYGGRPGDFGHASVAEQNQVFSNAIAAGGQSNWSPYDGC